MPLKLIVHEPISPLDNIVIKLFEVLIRELDDILLLIESHDGWDGSNVRVVVKVKSDEVIEKVFDAIERVERELGLPGKIIPDIVTPDEVRMQDVAIKIDIAEAILHLRNALADALGELLVEVKPHDGWDGSNVRVVVKVKSDEVIEKVFDAIERVERELGLPGKIIPDIVTPDES